MLSKLLKHEFRATARVMGPLYLVLLVLSLCANGSIRLLDNRTSAFLNIMGGLVLFLYGACIAAVCIITLVLMINRFRTNLLGDEGYVMFTLPASVHQQVWAKLIVSVVWFAASAVAVCLAALIAVFHVEYVAHMVVWAQQILQNITAYYAVNGTMMILETIVLCAVSAATCCLMFYAAMAIGHSFANHKTLLSVAFYVLFLVVLQVCGLTSAFNCNFDLHIAGAAAIHAFMGMSIAASAVTGAIFYVITTQMLKKHLNLE